MSISLIDLAKARELLVHMLNEIAPGQSGDVENIVAALEFYLDTRDAVHGRN